MTTPESDQALTPSTPPTPMPPLSLPASTPPTPMPTPPPSTPPNGVPPQYQQSPQPAPSGRAPIVALIAVAAVLALVTGLFTVLYLGERTDRDAVAATRADRERGLADVAAKQDEADATLETNRSRESTLTSEHDLLTQCVEAAKGYFDLPAEQTPESSRLFRIMYDICPQI
jgi:uncharacterized protein HemX